MYKRRLILSNNSNSNVIDLKSLAKTNLVVVSDGGVRVYLNMSPGFVQRLRVDVERLAVSRVRGAARRAFDRGCRVVSEDDYVDGGGV